MQIFTNLVVYKMLRYAVVSPFCRKTFFNRKYKVIDEMGEVNLGEFFCPNEACPDHGKRGRGNIVLKERYGKQNTALLRCKTCNKK